MSFFQKLKRLTVSSASSVGSTASSAVSASGGGSAAGAGGAAEEDEDAAATVLNPFTEAQVLQSHRDAVRLLLQIDPLRLVSGADDGRLCVWDVPSARLLRSLVGHSGRVNCAAMLNGLLLSAASDHTVRMWDPNSGECLMVLNKHKGSINCIVALQDNLFGCGGEHFSVYSTAGQLLGVHARYNRDSNLHALLPIKNSRIVAVSDSEIIEVLSLADQDDDLPAGAVATPRGSLGTILGTSMPNSLPANTPMQYAVNSAAMLDGSDSADGSQGAAPAPLQLFRQLTGHRDSVRCLAQATEAMFATASLDGVIVLWSAYSLTKVKHFNYHEIYKTSHTYLCSVGALLAVDSTMMAAAIGHGFTVYNVNTGNVVAKVASAHEADIQHMLLVAKGRVLVTCAADANIRLWSLAHLFDDCNTDDVHLAARNALAAPLVHSGNVALSPLRQRRVLQGSPKSSPRRLPFAPGHSPDHHKHSGASSTNTPSLLPPCIGEMMAHSGTVNQLVACGPHAFASCGSDHWVILWKNGAWQWRQRNLVASHVLRKL